MKTIITFIFVCFFSAMALAQAPPQLFNFQAVARDAMGEPIVNSQIAVIFRIRDGAETGPEIYIEAPPGVQTGEFGLFSHIIGEASPASFQAIDWTSGPKYLEVNINGETSVQQLVSVPYALYAQNAGFPPGTIIAYGGNINNIPPGWAYCDGTQIPIAQPGYENLFAAIEYNFGGEDGDYFNLPDFRGRFLRGADNESGRDPDADSRTAMNPGGNVGDNVGSVQSDATARPNDNFTITGNTNTAGDHDHKIAHNNDVNQTINGDLTGSEALAQIGSTSSPGQDLQDNNPNYEYELQGINATPNVGDTSISGNHSHSVSGSVSGGGDDETRPINAYVHYIIKL